jgi:hypothetical protein
MNVPGVGHRFVEADTYGELMTWCAGPTGRANRPRRRPSQRADQNVVSVASSRRNFGPST